MHDYSLIPRSHLACNIEKVVGACGQGYILSVNKLGYTIYNWKFGALIKLDGLTVRIKNKLPNFKHLLYGPFSQNYEYCNRRVTS